MSTGNSVLDIKTLPVTALVLVHRHLECPVTLLHCWNQRSRRSWLVSGVPCLLLATNLCWVSVGVHSVKTYSDTQSTDQLSQSTGCLSFQRPIVTEENIKLHPSHCLCFAQHEVILCLTWLSQLGWRSEKGAG